MLRCSLYIAALLVAFCLEVVQSHEESAIEDSLYNYHVQQQINFEFAQAGVDRMDKANVRTKHTAFFGYNAKAKQLGEEFKVRTWDSFVGRNNLTSAYGHDACGSDVIKCDDTAPYRTVDGTCNNLKNPDWGMSLTPFKRFLEPQYDDVQAEQLNQLTAYIDASHIYGSDKKDADSLRVFVDGLMKITDGNLLPYDNDAPDVCTDTCFRAGDRRVNEQIGLTSMHTIFLREHNRIARSLVQMNPHWNDETLYQETRKIIGAVVQKITFSDVLPMVLNTYTINIFGLSSDTEGYQNVYDDTVNAGIRNSNTASRLEIVYRHPEDIDLFTGGVAELPLQGGLVGPVFSCILGNQFSRTKTGDIFWFELGNQPTSFSLSQMEEIRKVTLSRPL